MKMAAGTKEMYLQVKTKVNIDISYPNCLLVGPALTLQWVILVNISGAFLYFHFQ